MRNSILRGAGVCMISLLCVSLCVHTCTCKYALKSNQTHPSRNTEPSPFTWGYTLTLTYCRIQHIYMYIYMYTYMINQSWRQGKGRQLHLTLRSVSTHSLCSLATTSQPSVVTSHLHCMVSFLPSSLPIYMYVFISIHFTCRWS